MFQVIDLYCERLGAGWFAEPLNVVTNLAYFAAAWFVHRRARRCGVLSTPLWILLVLVCAVGIGSSLFHVVASRLFWLFDVVPILLFQLLLIGLYCRDVLAMARPWTMLTLALFLAAVALGREFPELLNGSLAYAPTVVTVAALAVWHRLARRRGVYAMSAAAVVFLCASTFRTADIAICPILSTGTHFLWHLGSALVISLVMSAYIANVRFTPVERYSR